MKKFILTLLIISCTISLFACAKKVEIEDTMSEITYTYFKATNEKVNASISVGQREKTYIIDGKHTDNCEFSLISLKFEDQLLQNSIDVNISINEKVEEITLELNPANHLYMGDLGYSLKDNDKIILNYQNYVLDFVNVSKDFYVDSDRAISIALKEFNGELNDFYKKGNFEGECYLRILSQKNNEIEELFWIFTIIGSQQNSKNIVINVNDGTILIKN